MRLALPGRGRGFAALAWLARLVRLAWLPRLTGAAAAALLWAPLLLGSLAGTKRAAAQLNPGGSEIAAGVSATYQGQPAATSDLAGDFVAAWQRLSPTTGGWDIYARRFSRTGTPLTGEIQVNTTTGAGCRQNPAVASDALGNFLVVWQSNEESGGVTGIYGQLFTSTGAPSGGQFQINTTTSADALWPAAAMAPGGQFLVAWQSAAAPAGNGWGIVARAYQPGATSPSAEIAVNLTTAGAQHSPAAAYLAGAGTAGGYAVAWQSEGQDSPGVAGASAVFARLLDTSGNALSGELAVNAPGTGAHGHPRMAADPSGNFTVAWEAATAAGTVVLARRFSAAGTALVAPLTVDGSPAGAQADPVVVADARGDAVVAWDEAGVDGSGAAVLAQEFDNHAQPLGGKVQLNVTTAGDQAMPGLGLSEGGSFFAAWQSTPTAATGAVVTARTASLQEMRFYSVTPCRLVDTRNPAGPLGGPILTSGQVRNFPLLSSSCTGIPASARALSVNLTLVTPVTAGSVVTYPGDAPTPGINSVSVEAAQVRASNTILLLALGGNGSANVLPTFAPNGSNPGKVHFLIDVNGYFQ